MPEQQASGVQPRTEDTEENLLTALARLHDAKEKEIEAKKRCLVSLKEMHLD